MGTNKYCNSENWALFDPETSFLLELFHLIRKTFNHFDTNIRYFVCLMWTRKNVCESFENKTPQTFLCVHLYHWNEKRGAHWSSHSFKFNLILIKFLWRKGKSTAATRKPKNVTHMLHRLFNSFVPCRAFIYVAYVFFVNIRCGRCFSLHSKTPNPKFTLSFQLCV